MTDLSSMTYDELRNLQEEINDAVKEKHEKMREEGAETFLASDPGKALAERARNLKADFASLEKMLTKKRKARLEVDIKLEYELKYSIDQLFDAGTSMDVEDLFIVSAEGKLVNTKQFNSDFVDTIQNNIDDVLSNICGQGINLDKELSQQVETFLEDVSEFNADVEDASADFNFTVDDLLTVKKTTKKTKAKKNGKK